MRTISEDEYKTLSGTVLVDFSASWCGPCQQMGKLLESIEADYQGQVEFVKMDVDTCEEVASELGIKSIPTLVLMKNGVPTEYLVGSQSKGKIEAFLR